MPRCAGEQPPRSGGRTSGSTVAGVLAPLRRGRGDPTWRSGDGAGDLAGRHHAGRPGHAAAAPARRRHRGRRRRGGRAPPWALDGLPGAARRGRPARGVRRPPPAGRRRARAGCPGCGSARRGGCGTCWCRRCWSRRSPAPRRAARGASCAGASATRPPARRPAGMRVPPTPAQVRAVPDWEWHRAGVDLARRRAILACGDGGAPAGARPASWAGSAGRELLRRVPGIGVWTAAEVAQRAWGDPDAVSFGDFHIPTVVGWALLGRPLDDAGMLAGARPVRAAAPAGGALRRGLRLPPPALRPAVLPARLPGHADSGGGATVALAHAIARRRAHTASRRCCDRRGRRCGGARIVTPGRLAWRVRRSRCWSAASGAPGSCSG